MRHCGTISRTILAGKGRAVPTTERAEVQAAWHAMSRRYGWSLVSNEAAFVERALIERQQLQAAGKPDSVRACIWRVYGALIYERLRERDDLGAQELWKLFTRTAMKRGTRQDVAEDMAQEAVLRVLVNLPALRSPASFLTWALRIASTVRLEFETANAREHSPEPTPEHETLDEHDFTQAVENGLAEAEIVAQINARLSNQLERAVIIRAMIHGAKPRDIAADLNIPAPRIRLAKSRAIQQLSGDEEFKAWLRNLYGGSARAMGDTGAPNDDE